MSIRVFRSHEVGAGGTRRAFLGALALGPLAACTTTSGALEAPSPPPTPADDAFYRFEARYDARIGIFAMDTGSGNVVVHRSDDRFAFCSTHKVITAATVLHANPPGYVDTVVSYPQTDLVTYSPVTERHVNSGMTIGALCDAAIRFSDNTAANLLVRELGGPAEVTKFARSLGDDLSTFDRLETELNSAVPGELRDTSTPRAFASLYRSIVLEDVLDPKSRAFITDLMVRNTTGDRQIRAGTPGGWVVADKTGSGSYGTGNDIAILWPPSKSPILLVVMTSRNSEDADRDPDSIANATRTVLDRLGAK